MYGAEQMTLTESAMSEFWHIQMESLDYNESKKSLILHMKGRFV